MKLFRTEEPGVNRLSKERLYLTAMVRSFINPAKKILKLLSIIVFQSQHLLNTFGVFGTIGLSLLDVVILCLL